jgi:hypothetical protein
MAVPTEKIALFIDGANLYATAKTLGFDIDYKRLLREFQSRGYLLRAFYYTAVIEDQEYSSIRPLIDWLDYNGYTVVTKATKEFVDQSGRRKVKGNMDIELAVNAMEIAPLGRSHRAVLRRRRFPLAGRGDPAQGRARDGGVHHLDPAADGRRRVAPPVRHLPRHRRAADRRSAAIRPSARRRAPRDDRDAWRDAVAATAATRRNSCSARPRRNARAPRMSSTTKSKRAKRPTPRGRAAARLSALPAPRRVPQGMAQARAGLVQRAGAFVRADRRAAADRRPCARACAAQPHRAAFHRRLRRATCSTRP